MQKDIKFLRLYNKTREGFAIDSIIAYKKMEYLIQYGNCIQYKKYLHINLWFIIINLSWFTKIK